MKKVSIKHLVILIIAFVIIFVTGTFYLKYTSKKYEEMLIKSNQKFLIEVTQIELNQKIADNESFYVYIGSSSCPDCESFRPELEEILSDTNEKMLYYSTEYPSSKKQEIRDYLKTFDVKSIPSIMFFSDGKINKLYDCADNEQVQNFIKNFKGEMWWGENFIKIIYFLKIRKNLI